MAFSARCLPLALSLLARAQSSSISLSSRSSLLASSSIAVPISRSRSSVYSRSARAGASPMAVFSSRARCLSLRLCLKSASAAVPAASSPLRASMALSHSTLSSFIAAAVSICLRAPISAIVRGVVLWYASRKRLRTPSSTLPSRPPTRHTAISYTRGRPLWLPWMSTGSFGSSLSSTSSSALSTT